MNRNLLIGILGDKNAGKSTTWYNLFKEKVKTGANIRKLYLTEGEYIEVFLINGSAEERGIPVEQMIGTHRPRIVLCAMQYTEKVMDTIDYFSRKNYSMYIQWLTPGHNDLQDTIQFDNLGLIQRLLAQHKCIFSIRSGKTEYCDDRVREITDYLYGWANSRKLINTKS